jgi:hypothetical protein
MPSFWTTFRRGFSVTSLLCHPIARIFTARRRGWPDHKFTSWPPELPSGERKACEPDAQLHCPDEMPDHAKVQACLARKVKLLSPACKQLIENAGKRRHRVRGH